MKDKKIKEKVLRAIYERILLYSFLTQSKLSSLKDLIDSISESETNQRILSNLELSCELLKVIQEKANSYTLCVLNSKIWTNNSILKDGSISSEEKKTIIETKFSGTTEGLMLQSTEGLLCEKTLLISSLL